MISNNAATVNSASASQVSSVEINRVSVKLSPFWEADPATWFVNVEAQFALANIITDETKYNYVVANLDPKYWAEVQDILRNPPSSGRYEKLKFELIRRLSASQDQKTRRLLEHEEIGDRKPSQFLRHLRGLAGNVIPDDVLRPLWLARLPAFTQAILASQGSKSLDELADLADSIAEASPRAQVAETSADTPLHLLFRQLSVMQSEIAELKASMQKEISELRRPQGNRFRRSHSRHRSASRSRNRPDICWYHSKFGSEAQKCTQPCNYGTGNDTGRR